MTTKRVLLIGDIHGDIDSLGYARDLARSYECDHIIQLGDFGLYWSGYADEFTQAAWRMFKNTRSLIVLPGNHENYTVLDERGWLTRRSPVVLPQRAGFYMPTGARVRIGESWCLFYGGAFSIDKAYRTEGRSWWPEEVSTPEQHVHAMHWNGRVDTVLSHDAPLWANIVVGRRMHDADKMDWPETLVNRTKLQEVADKYHPTSWFHGHWHTSYVDTRQCDGVGHSERIEGLNCNMLNGFWTIKEF